MVEIFFNETKLIDLFKKFGLVVVGVQTTGKFNLPELPEPVFMKNYLCAKRSF